MLELPTRPVSEYTLAQLQCALQAADGGSMRLAADLTRAAITQSGFISGILDTISSGILGLPRTFVGGDERVRLALDGDDDRESEYDALFPRAEAKRIMAWGVTLGIGIGQFVENPEGQPGPPEDTTPILAQPLMDGSFAVPMPATRRVGENATPGVRAWDPRWLRYQWHDDSWHLTTARGEIRIRPGDGEWLLFTPYGRSKPSEWGSWRFLTLAFVMMRDGIFDRSRHSEVLAPVRVGVVPKDTTERQRAKFSKQIETMQRMGWFVLPDGLDYKIVESTGRVADIYKDVIEWGEGEATVGLTGNKVSVEGNRGFGEGDVFERTTASKRKFYAQAWADCARAQGIRWWARDNYGDVVPPRVEYNTDPPGDKDAEIKRIGDCGNALSTLVDGLDRIGFELDDDDGIVALVARCTGLRARRKATASVAVAQLDLAPTDVAKVVRAVEARASKRLPPFGDERDNKTIAELGESSAAPPLPEPGQQQAAPQPFPEPA